MHNPVVKHLKAFHHVLGTKLLVYTSSASSYHVWPEFKWIIKK